MLWEWLPEIRVFCVSEYAAWMWFRSVMYIPRRIPISGTNSIDNLAPHRNLAKASQNSPDRSMDDGKEAGIHPIIAPYLPKWGWNVNLWAVSVTLPCPLCFSRTSRREISPRKTVSFTEIARLLYLLSYWASKMEHELLFILIPICPKSPSVTLPGAI